MTTIVVATLILVFAIFFGIVFKKVHVKKGQENRQVSIRLTKWVLWQQTELLKVVFSDEN